MQTSHIFPHLPTNTWSSTVAVQHLPPTAQYWRRPRKIYLIWIDLKSKSKSADLVSIDMWSETIWNRWLWMTLGSPMTTKKLHSSPTRRVDRSEPPVSNLHLTTCNMMSIYDVNIQTRTEHIQLFSSENSSWPQYSGSITEGHIPSEIPRVGARRWRSSYPWVIHGAVSHHGRFP
jgi:hypothetical protein